MGHQSWEGIAAFFDGLLHIVHVEPQGFRGPSGDSVLAPISHLLEALESGPELALELLGQLFEASVILRAFERAQDWRQRCEHLRGVGPQLHQAPLFLSHRRINN